MLVRGVLCVVRKGCTPCPVVPPNLRKQLMEEHHGGPCASHFGVPDHVTPLEECMEISCSLHRVHHRLRRWEDSPSSNCCPETIQDLPLTKQGNRHVLVFQDHFSKWPMVYAMCIARILCEDLCSECQRPYRGLTCSLIS